MAKTIVVKTKVIKGDKRVCLRDRLLAERQAIRQRDAVINDQLKSMDTETAIKWVNARIRECKVLAKQPNVSRVISETYQKALGNVWEKIYRHDLSPEMVARSVENVKKTKMSKPLATILSDPPADGETLRDMIPDE